MKTLYQYLAFGLALPIIVGCEHDAPFGDNPTSEEVFGEFAVKSGLSISADEADFGAGETVYFSADFTTIANWKITITGLSSGLTKTIAGNSKSINADNATWNGAADIPNFVAEQASIKLTIDGNDYSDSAGFTIVSPRDYSQLNGVLFTGFNEDDPKPGLMASANQTINTRQTELGGTYWTIEGLDPLDDNGNRSWWIGGIQFIAPNIWPGEKYIPIENNDPENTYFNMYLYSTKQPGLRVTFGEDEDGNGRWDRSYEDAYWYRFDETWEGWKLVSIKFSEFNKEEYGPEGGAGNAVPDIDKIVEFNVLMLPEQPNTVGRASFDFPIITFGAPFEP